MFNNNSTHGDWTVAAGSVTGREHLRLHRNNQDGWALHVAPGRIVAALCDGCSAGHSSEVGARLAAAFVAARLPRILEQDPSADRLAERLSDDLVMYMKQIVEGLGGGASAVAEHLLFTLLIAVVEPERTLILGLGDGVYAIDGEVRVVGPFAGNAPPYLGYRLVDPAHLGEAPLEPLTIWHQGGPAETLALASDGLAELPREEWQQLTLLCARNPSLLQKRLNVWERRFADDATAVIIRRREGAGR